MTAERGRDTPAASPGPRGGTQRAHGISGLVARAYHSQRAATPLAQAWRHPGVARAPGGHGCGRVDPSTVGTPVYDTLLAEWGLPSDWVEPDA